MIKLTDRCTVSVETTTLLSATQVC